MKIIQKGTYTGDIISTTLSNRGIENLELFLDPSNVVESDPNEFLNTDKARSILFKHLAANNKIVILVDADADGYTSASILYNYIQDIDPNANLEYIVHEVKAHGLTQQVMEEIEEIAPFLVIIPDAGSNDIAQITKLEVYQNIDVIILDHHHVSEFTDLGTIVNNQLCPMTNHNFTGAGVVYKFIQGIDEMYGYDYADYYLDLVAIGQIGDASDISDPEIRNLVLKGLDNINNPLLKVSVNNALGFGKRPTSKDMSFSVIPLINAVTRVGTIEERELLFEALCGIGNTRKFEVPKKKKNKDTGKFDTVIFNWNLYEYTYDILTKVKARQAAVVKKLLPSVEQNIVESGIVIGFTPEDTPGISGLVANKLTSKFDKPALLLNEKEEVFTGSGRGHEKTIADFRKWCEDSNLVEFAQGHDNAFGISIRKDQMDAFKEYAGKIEKQETIYEVDIITDKPVKEHCEEVDRNRSLFGGRVSEPLIGIVGLIVPKRFLGLKGSVLSIYSWGVSMIKFGSDENEYEALMGYPDENVRLNIVGTYSMNEWSGRKVPQLIIKDLEIVYVKDEEINEENIIF